MAYLNRLNDYGDSSQEVDGSTAPLHPMRQEIDRLRKVISKAQALADAELVDHSTHVREDGTPCQFANERTWRHKWARDLHVILASED